MIQESLSTLILGLKDQGVRDLEDEKRIILDQKQGEGLYIVKNKRVHMKVDLTPEELALLPRQGEARKQ